MQHVTEEQLILFHYGEAEDKQEISRHLEACPGCHCQYEALSQALGSIVLTGIPERGPGYGSEVWHRLAPELVERRRHRLTRWLEATLGGSGTGKEWPSPNPRPRAVTDWHLRPWCVGAGLALLVGGAFLAGWFWPHPVADRPLAQAPTVSLVASPSRPKAPLKELGDHLERSQLALIELINSKTNGPVDLSMEQVLARELIDVNRLFCRTAAQLGDGDGVLSALEDLERTLLEISNSPPRLSSEQFADLRRRLGPDAVLCKIKAVGAQVRAREREEELARNHS